jgi:hypothetical protein
MLLISVSHPLFPKSKCRIGNHTNQLERKRKEKKERKEKKTVPPSSAAKHAGPDG